MSPLFRVRMTHWPIARTTKKKLAYAVQRPVLGAPPAPRRYPAAFQQLPEVQDRGVIGDAPIARLDPGKAPHRLAAIQYLSAMLSLNLRDRFHDVAEIVDEAKHDVPAYVAFDESLR